MRPGCGPPSTPTAGDDLEEELVDLDLAPGLGEVAAPRVKAVAREEESVKRRTFRIAPVGGEEPGPDPRGELRHRLGIGEDRHLFAGVVGGDAIEALEHLVALDPHGAAPTIGAGEDRRPDRMGVEHGADGGDQFGDEAVEEGLGGGLPPRAVARYSSGIDADEVVACEDRLVFAADGDRQFERGTAGDDAVVAARP